MAATGVVDVDERRKDSDSPCDYHVESLVWYRRNSDTGWWPCAVLGVTGDGEERSVNLVALGDEYPYGWVRAGSPNLQPFPSPECKTKVEKQLKRMQRRGMKQLLPQFVVAVREALERCPSFHLDIDLPSDRDLAESSRTPNSTPLVQHNWSFLNDSNIFTPGTDSRGRGDGVVTRSLRRRSQQRPTTPTEDHSGPQRTTHKTKTDVLVKISHKSSRRKRRKHSTSPYSEKSKSEMERKTDEESSEVDSELPMPIRRKLDLEDSTGEDDVIPDILTACDPVSRGTTRSTEEGVGGGGRENGGGEMSGTTENGGERDCSNGQHLIDAGVLSEVVDGGGEMSASEPVKERKTEEEGEEEERGEVGLKKVKEEEREKQRKEKRKVKEKEEEKMEGEEEGEGGEVTTEEEEESESSDDDDLPVYQTSSTTKIIVSELKEGDHIWTKYKTYPHWPALVVKAYPAKKKHKSYVKIVYFGDNPDYAPVNVKHSQRHNLARYVRGNQEYEKFMKAGRECGQHANYFLQSVKEAEAFIAAKCNKELTGSALEMFKQICDKRPSSMTAALVDQNLSFRQQEPPTVSAFGFRLDQDFADGREGEEEEKEEEEEEEGEGESDTEEDENSLYTIEKIRQFFTQLKPTLTAIMSGATPSEYHQVYTSGTAKQKRQLLVCGKYGPCRKWSTAKKMELIQHLQKITDCPAFGYAGDVLLPEAMVRTISHFEGISLEEALKKM